MQRESEPLPHYMELTHLILKKIWEAALASGHLEDQRKLIDKAWTGASAIWALE